MEENKIEDTLNGASEKAAGVSENVNEVKEAIAEAAADVKDAAEEAVADAKEAAEDVAADAAKAEDAIKSEIEEAKADIQDAEAKLEDIEKKIGEEAEEGRSHDPRELKGIAPNSTPVDIKKGRKPMPKGGIIAIVVGIVVVLAALAFIGANNGWFKFLTNKSGDVELPDLSRIEVYKEDIEVTDDTIQYYIDSILSSQATTEEVTDGAVENGDTVNIDYAGVRKDTGEAFEGGTAEGQDLVIGSGTFIDGFEDGLVGAKVGDTKELDLTFPEDYSEKSLAGQDVTFTVTVNSISRTKTPELTDEWVKEYSTKYCPQTYNTVDEFRQYAKDTVVDFYLHQAMFTSIQEKSTVKAYNTEDEEMLKEYSNQNLEYYAGMYGTDVDTAATMYGYNNAEEYNTETAHQYQDIQMIVDAIFKQKNLSYTDEELKEAVVQYMKDNRYNDMYDVDEFIQQSGDTWMWLFTNLEFKFGKAMDALEDNVVVLEEKPTTEEDVAEEALGDAAIEEDIVAEEGAEETIVVSETDAETGTEAAETTAASETTE